MKAPHKYSRNQLWFKAFVASALIAILSTANVFAQECNIVYVKAGGATVGSAGTKGNPASLLYGLTLSNSTDNKIYMASGTYYVFNAINMKSNVSIEGGFDVNTWVKSNGTTTTIFRDNSNVQSTPTRLVAMYCTSLTNFRLQDLTIQCSNAFGSGASSYGIYMTGCSNYVVSRCKIISGNAGNGANGTNGTSGLGGGAGIFGENGEEQGPCCTLGGAGGTGSFGGSYAGGQAGDGAVRGTASCSFCGDPTDATNGSPGTSGLGPGGGIGGNGGAKIVVCIYPISCKRTPVNDGQPGVAGTDGLPGTAGTDGFGFYAGGLYFPGDGTPGTPATHGSGGGGGGGGGSLGGIPFDCLFGLPPNWNGAGAGGGGGGEGGEGALGGTGGTGGGGSFSVYLDNNGANGIIKDCQLTPGNPGLGGLGGLGGVGGAGGVGGLGGGLTNCNIGAGGTGGNGGQGGAGGPGGRGSDGIVFALYEDPTGTPVSLMNINSLQQPFVSVKFSGCTELPVVFSTTASGTANWFFGAGSTPSSDIANPAIASYTTTGRKTFTLVNNGIPYTYTDFLDISGNGAGMNPTISNFMGTDTICIGSTASFGSSITANSYEWLIEQDTTWDTLSGAGFFSIIDTFNTLGTFMVILRTYNNCCGQSFPDTILITVTPIANPSITIQSSDTSNLVCQGTNLTFSASADSVTQPFYQWYVNGAPAGLNSPTYSTSGLADGDSVSCSVMTTTGCSAGLFDNSNVISVTVVGFPSVTCTADTFITDNPTYFSSGITSGGIAPFTYTWDFGDQTMGSGDSVAHIFTEPGVYDVQVNVADSNGCPGSCSMVVSIFSVLNSQFSSGPYNGCAPLDVSFFNESSNAITYLWEFGDGSTSVDENPMYTYNNPGTYTVTLNAFSSSGTDTSVFESQVLVLPSPIANFQAYPQVVTDPTDTVFFADNSWNAWTWEWYFGDPSSGDNYSTDQNPWHYYANNGAYTVTLVVTNAVGCADSLTKPNFILVGIDSGGVGINDQVNLNSFIIYPNPVTTNLNVEILSMEAGYMDIGIRNYQGALVDNINRVFYSPGKTTNQINLDDLDLSEGMYYLDLKNGGNHVYKKFIYIK